MDHKKEGVPTTKVHYAPGGKSNFSLGWDPEPVQPLKPKNTPVQQPPAQQQSKPTPSPVVASQQGESKPTSGAHTSVKVHNPPGGKSNFTLG